MKPDDITKEDWKAGKVWQDWFYDDIGREVQEAVARAIMEEREQCANIVEMGDLWTGRFEHATAIRSKANQ